MKEIARLRKLQADCRRRARSEPERKWHWLAQAAKYQIQANLEITQFPADPNAPDITLASISGVTFPPLKMATVFLDAGSSHG